MVLNQESGIGPFHTLTYISCFHAMQNFHFILRANKNNCCCLKIAPDCPCNKALLVKWLSNGHCKEFFNHRANIIQNRIHSSKLETWFISLYNSKPFPLLNKKAINFLEACSETSLLNVNTISIFYHSKNHVQIKYFGLLYFLLKYEAEKLKRKMSL